MFSWEGEDKEKGKFNPRTGYEGSQWEYRCNSTLSSTSAMMGVGCQRHASPPGERDPVPIVQEAGLAPEMV